MALHVVPTDEYARHRLSTPCPCTVRIEQVCQNDGSVRLAHVHTSLDQAVQAEPQVTEGDPTPGG